MLIETPANPTLTMSDIQQAADAVRRHPKRPLLAVDNTFMGPTFQHPLARGADLVIYSATKFLGGFSDLLAGVVMAADSELIQRLAGIRALLGNILQADECWILDSRLSTVGLRMNRQSKNAQRIAEALAKHPKIERLLYPSLFTDPEQIRIRDAQTDYPGSLMSLEIKGGKTGAFEFLRHLKIAKNAVSLGGVEIARLSSEDDHSQRIFRGGICAQPASPMHWCGFLSAPSIGAISSMSSPPRSTRCEP